METIPRKALWAVVIALIGLAGLGVFQGMQRGAADQASVEAGVLPASTTASSAKAASPLNEATGLTESQVREIARQEARNVLGRPESSSAPAADREAAPSAPRLAPATAAPDRPAAAPSPPASPAGDAGQPPLF